ncbi:hypothetical protein QE152_g220 [Popillia japonica]|uniref:Protein quiver n=1 Tax=Popillia japonica TaxID=7064 RepID=A0AAW1NBP3_POPJA
MATSALLVAVIGVLCFNLATAVNVTQCFRCTSPGNPECDDEFDITQGVPVKCDSLIYLRKFEQPTDLIENVFIQERASNTTVFQFYCVKLGVQYQNGTAGIIRSCHQHPDNVADVSSCDVCNDRDNCNSAGSIYASILMIFVAAILIKSC